MAAKRNTTGQHGGGTSGVTRTMATKPGAGTAVTNGGGGGGITLRGLGFAANVGGEQGSDTATAAPQLGDPAAGAIVLLGVIVAANGLKEGILRSSYL